jgi:hypothetical protein
MIVLKVRNSWKHVGAMPLLRALVLDGFTFYCVFLLAFSVEMVATARNEVGVLHLYHVR